jgi:hypothetical protein
VRPRSALGACCGAWVVRGRAASLLLVLPLAVLACGRTIRERMSVPVIAPSAQRAWLNEVPYDQPYAFVSVSSIFHGVEDADTSELDREGLARIRATLDVPLASLGWREVEPSQARFRIALVHVDGPAREWRESPMVLSGTAAGTCWFVMTVGSLHRGFAIERVSDSAVFWRVHRGGAFDAGVAEQYLGAELLKLAMLQHPGPERRAVASPPAGAPLCAWTAAGRSATSAEPPSPPVRQNDPDPTRRPPTAAPPPNAPPTPPPTRKPCCD